MVSLTGYLREQTHKGTYDAEDIIRKYEAWVLKDKYMVMAHEREAWLPKA